MAEFGQPGALAWEWFKFHADQRLRAFNFYIVIVGAILVAIKDPVTSKSFAEVALLAGFGLIASGGFFGLDIRNSQLVAGGKSILIETSREAKALFAATDKRSIVDRLVRHRIVLRIFIFTAGLGFGFTFVWAAVGLISNGKSFGG